LVGVGFLGGFGLRSLGYVWIFCFWGGGGRCFILFFGRCGGGWFFWGGGVVVFFVVERGRIVCLVLVVFLGVCFSRLFVLLLVVFCLGCVEGESGEFFLDFVGGVVGFFLMIVGGVGWGFDCVDFFCCCGFWGVVSVVIFF